mgnify:CR=1 FL=1
MGPPCGAGVGRRDALAVRRCLGWATLGILVVGAGTWAQSPRIDSVGPGSGSVLGGGTLVVRGAGFTPVVEGGRSDDVRPDEIGLAIDYAATVDAAGAGDSWSLERQWEYFTGGDDDLVAIVDVDETLLSDRLAEVVEHLRHRLILGRKPGKFRRL